MLIAQPAFPHYVDTDGTPITSGSLYYGTVGANPRTSPVAIYWDAAGTQPAPQPVRTVAGYPVRNGSPANVYINGAYSVALYNAAGELVFYAPDSASFDAILSGTTVYARQLLGADDAAEARVILDAPSNDEALLLSGGTMVGKIVLDGDASSALHAVPKQQLDSAVSTINTALGLRMQYSLTASLSTASGLSVDVLSIPSWATRITVTLNGVSTNGTFNPQFQLGSGSFATSGYAGSQSLLTTVVNTGSLSGGFTIGGASDVSSRCGVFVFTHQGGNAWACSGVIGFSDSAGSSICAGVITLAGVIDRLRLFAGGTDAFDGGGIRVLIEG